MIGDSPQRRCLANGDWSGSIPRCLELALVNELENNSIEGRADEHSDALESSKAIGIGIAVGAGALLIFIIIIAVVCLKA